MNEELDLLELFYAFWKKKIWFIIAVVLGAVLGFVYTEFIIVPKYTSSVTLILSKPTNATSSILDAGNEAAITQSDIQLNQKLISTYSEIMKSRRISNTVIKNLNLDMTYEEIINCINVSFVKDTDVIKLSITTTDPYMSAEIATEMTNVFTKEIVEVYNIQNISIIDEAEVDEEPVNISHIKNIVIFAMVAFILVAGVVFIIYYFDNSIKSTDDIQKITGLPVLCTVPKFEEVKGGKK